MADRPVTMPAGTRPAPDQFAAGWGARGYLTRWGVRPDELANLEQVMLTGQAT